MLISTQVEVVVEVGVELGNINYKNVETNVHNIQASRTNTSGDKIVIIDA